MRRQTIGILIVIAVTALVPACSSSPSTVAFGSPSPGDSATPSPTATQMPSVLYRGVGTAESILKSAHLRFGIQHKATISYQPGTILSQSPKPGAAVKFGQVVSLVVSVAPACDPSYPTVCIKPFQPNLTCKGIPYRNFPVVAPDDDHLDPDHNGYACQNVKAHPHPSP